MAFRDAAFRRRRGPLPRRGYGLDMSSSRLERVAANKARDAAFFPRVVEQGNCFTWGTDAGITPWEDRNGDTLLPFWPDEASAFSENLDDVEPGEKVLERSLEQLVGGLHRW